MGGSGIPLGLDWDPDWLDYGLEPLHSSAAGLWSSSQLSWWTIEPLTAYDWLDYGLEPLTAQLVEHRPGSKTAEASLSGQLPADQ